MKIYVYFSDEQDKVKLDFDVEELIKNCTEQALIEEEISDDAEISVTFVDNEGIRELNKMHRDIDRETDVLSFPAFLDEGFEVDPENDAVVLGDIVISLEKALRQSEEYGHSMKRETAFLIAHSLFHLLGYDHMTEDEEKEMFEKQEKVLQKLGVTR